MRIEILSDDEWIQQVRDEARRAHRVFLYSLVRWYDEDDRQFKCREVKRRSPVKTSLTAAQKYYDDLRLDVLERMTRSRNQKRRFQAIREME